MRNDPGSNYNLMEVYASADVAIGTLVSSVVDHGLEGRAASFLVSIGSTATDSATTTLQHSASPTTDFVDEVAGLGNTVSATVASPSGNCQIDVPNPRERYSRVKVATQGQTNLSVMAVAGPKTQIIPPDGVLES